MVSRPPRIGGGKHKSQETGGKQTIREQLRELRCLGQMYSNEAGRTFRVFLRASVRQCLINVMADEVRQLCEPKLRRKPGAHECRAGSSPGVAICEGRREKIVRPRVRLKKADRQTEDVHLATYTAAGEPGQLKDATRENVGFLTLGRRFFKCSNDFGSRAPFCHLRIQNATGPCRRW